MLDKIAKQRDADLQNFNKALEEATKKYNCELFGQPVILQNGALGANVMCRNKPEQ